MTNAASICELFKVLRAGPMSRPDIQRSLGWSQTTVDKWCLEMTAQGMLVETLSERMDRSGPRPMLYALSPEWGGRQ